MKVHSVTRTWLREQAILSEPLPVSRRKLKISETSYTHANNLRPDWKTEVSLDDVRAELTTNIYEINGEKYISQNGYVYQIRKEHGIDSYRLVVPNSNYSYPIKKISLSGVL